MRDSKQTAATVKPGWGQSRCCARIRPIVCIGIFRAELEPRMKMALVRSLPGGMIGSSSEETPLQTSPMEECPMSSRWPLPVLWLVLTSLARADGPQDNLLDRVGPIPPKGIALAEADRSELQAGVDALGKEIDASAKRASRASLSYCRSCRTCRSITTPSATRWPTTSSSSPGKSRSPRTLLEQGLERARQLREGKAPWNTATGLVVRGYVSKIDGSVQPYGLVVPASYQPDTPASVPARYLVPRPRRDAERGRTSSTAGRRRPASSRRPTPSCCIPTAATATPTSSPARSTCSRRSSDVKKQYPIDEDRLVMRGFSMGGAACWQFAVHYPGMWAAARPGPASPRRADFLKVFQNEKLAADLVRAEALAPVRLHRLRRRTCSTARPWPTAARATGRSRPPT